MSQHTMSTRVLKLESSDKQIFEVEENVAMISQTINNVLEWVGNNEIIPLPGVGSQTLDKVIEWCKKHVGVNVDDAYGDTEKRTKLESYIDNLKKGVNVNVNIDDDDDHDHDDGGVDIEEFKKWESVNLNVVDDDDHADGGVDIEEFKKWESVNVIVDDDDDDDDGGGGVDIEEFEKWESDFFNVDTETLFDIFMAANYLNVSDMTNRIACKVARMIKGKTTEECREIFNIKKDFSPGEEEQVCKEHAWAFDD